MGTTDTTRPTISAVGERPGPYIEYAPEATGIGQIATHRVANAAAKVVAKRQPIGNGGHAGRGPGMTTVPQVVPRFLVSILIRPTRRGTPRTKCGELMT